MAMSKVLAPLTASRDQTGARPTVYKGTKDGTVDGRPPLMGRFLERDTCTFQVHKNRQSLDKN